ncbi:MAG: hypothetical protein IT204_23295 [Fimbriimonadaceae bacterium]|nr:hypothetical protein [Fimbriimonadaceae bacterium]
MAAMCTVAAPPAPPARAAWWVVDNLFLQLEARRLRRRGDAAGWVPAAAFVVLAALVWQRFASRDALAGWPFGMTIWNPIVALHALLVAVATGLPAWRLSADLQHEGNATALALTRLRPLEALSGRALPAAGAGLRMILCGLPVYLALRLLPGPPAPALGGVAVVLAGVALYALLLSAAAGAAAVRTRHASLEDWSDLIFNVRTLTAAFLNPLWIFLAVLLTFRSGQQLGLLCGGVGPWFGLRLPYLLLALPAVPWARRQLAGLATTIYGETPALAQLVVRGSQATYVSAALLLVGFTWEHGLARFALPLWWDLSADRQTAAQLLLTLLLWAALPQVVFAGYAAALRCGLRSGTTDGDERLPTAAALWPYWRAVAWAGLLPWLVTALCLQLGGWPLSAAGGPFLGRAAAVWVAVVAAAGAYLLGLLVTAAWRTTRRELLSLALVLPALAGPFLGQWKHPLGTAVSACSPFSVALWLPPDAGTGLGNTSDLPLPGPWPQAVAVQLAVALTIGALAAVVLQRGLRPGLRRARAARPAPVSTPVLHLDLLLLHRRGWLLSPFAMLLGPVLGAFYFRLGPMVEASLRDAISLFLWHRNYLPAGDPAAALPSMAMAAIGLQLLLHPAGLAGVRCFARDHAAGRLDAWWLTPLSVRQIVLSRYLGVTLPFGFFWLLTALPVALAGHWVGQPWVTTAGLCHWLAVILLLPALTLAGTVRREWRGQGLAAIATLELLRILWSQALPQAVGPPTGMLWANGLLLLLALPLTAAALGATARQLAFLRAGGTW